MSCSRALALAWLSPPVVRRARIRAVLAPAPGAQSIAVADHVVRVDAGGRHDVHVPLTADDRWAAASCTPLVLTVRSPGAPRPPAS